MRRIVGFLFPAGGRTAQESLFLLALRLLFGGLMLLHGIAKLRDFGVLSAAFADPLGLGSRFSLLLALFAEVLCSAGIVAGAFFRLALVPLIFMLGVALFVVHGGDPFAARELAVIYLSVFVLLFLSGPGNYALDRIVAARISR